MSYKYDQRSQLQKTKLSPTVPMLEELQEGIASFLVLLPNHVEILEETAEIYAVIISTMAGILSLDDSPTNTPNKPQKARQTAVNEIRGTVRRLQKLLRDLKLVKDDLERLKAEVSDEVSLSTPTITKGRRLISLQKVDCLLRESLKLQISTHIMGTNMVSMGVATFVSHPSIEPNCYHTYKSSQVILPLTVVSAMLAIPNLFGTEPNSRIFVGMTLAFLFLLIAVYACVHNWLSPKNGLDHAVADSWVALVVRMNPWRRMLGEHEQNLGGLIGP